LFSLWLLASCETTCLIANLGYFCSHLGFIGDISVKPDSILLTGGSSEDFNGILKLPFSLFSSEFESLLY
jgi:hypothetical protein